MKYPLILKISERHQDPWYYICNDVEELKKASLEAFNNLKGRIYQEEPQKNMFPEVTDEYIKNAPERVQQDLKDIQEKRQKWLSENHWRNTYKEAKHYYDLYQKALDGDGGSAYKFLEWYGYLRIYQPTEI